MVNIGQSSLKTTPFALAKGPASIELILKRQKKGNEKGIKDAGSTVEILKSFFICFYLVYIFICQSSPIKYLHSFTSVKSAVFEHIVTMVRLNKEK